MPNSLDKIAELLPDLIQLHEPTDEVLGSNITILKSDKGQVIGKGLLKTNEIAVAHWVLTDGAQLENHVHNGAIEYVFVYEGEIVLEWDDHTSVFNKDTGPAILPKNVKHRLVDTHGKTLLIALTLPADQGYPDVK